VVGMRVHASLANWRIAPFNHWAFHHVRELIPSADIANDPHAIAPLARGSCDFKNLRIEPDSGEALDLEAFIRETDTDGMAIVHRGRPEERPLHLGRAAFICSF
jgi:hypothetical protein